MRPKPQESKAYRNPFKASMSTTTFVTFFIDLEQKDPSLKQTDYRFACFEKLAATGIPICVFVSENHKERIQGLCKLYPTIHLMGSFDFTQSVYASYANQYVLSLPSVRSIPKDTHAFLNLQNSKLECVQRVMDINPFQTDQFAWIDFNIFHIVKNDEVLFKKYLKNLCSMKLKQRDKVYMPGCTAKISHPQSILEKPNWRFCGGFFIGTANALRDMNEIIEDSYDSFFRIYKQATWEVNLWAYCEAFCGLEVVWYKADHDESIICVPSHELRPDSYADIYYLSPPGCERDQRMKARFSALGIVPTHVYGKREENGCMYGHLRMLREFYETSTKEFGVFLEDDVYLRKGFMDSIQTLCQTMIEKDLDLLLIGYLLPYSPRDSHGSFPTLSKTEKKEKKEQQDYFSFHSFPEDTWGSQGYIVSRAQAAYLLEKLTDIYKERTEAYSLPCYAVDWTITKFGKRALTYPMLAVEEGTIESSHAGQQAFHRSVTQYHYDPAKYI